MIYIPDHFLIGEDKYEPVSVRKSIFKFENKEFKELVGLGLTKLVYMPSSHSNVSFLSDRNGFLVNQWIVDSLVESEMIKEGQPLVYLEHYGQGFYLLMIDEKGYIQTEIIEDVIENQAVSNERVFDKDKFSLLISRIESFVAEKGESVKGIASTSQVMDDSAFFNETILVTSQTRLRNFLDGMRIGSSIDFDIADEGTEKSFLSMGVPNAKSNVYIPNLTSSDPFLSQLLVSFQSAGGDTKGLKDKFCPSSVKKFTKKKNVNRFYLATAIIGFIGILTIPRYLEEQRLEEEARNKIITVQRTIDEHKEYRRLIGVDGMNAEMALKQISLALGVFNKSLSSQQLSWKPIKFEASDVNVGFSMLPVGDKPDNGNLAKFAKQNRLAQFYSDNQQMLGYGMKRYAVNSEYYLTPVDSEIRYLEDTIDFLFDYSTLSIGQRVGHESWSSVLVNVDFNCWLPSEIEYFSTQLYPRNYGFVSMKAEYTDAAEVEGSEDIIMPCGYSGQLSLEIYGHKGTGLSSSQSKKVGENHG